MGVALAHPKGAKDAKKGKGTIPDSSPHGQSESNSTHVPTVRNSNNIPATSPSKERIAEAADANRRSQFPPWKVSEPKSCDQTRELQPKLELPPSRMRGPQSMPSPTVKGKPSINNRSHNQSARSLVPTTNSGSRTLRANARSIPDAPIGKFPIVVPDFNSQANVTTASVDPPSAVHGSSAVVGRGAAGPTWNDGVVIHSTVESSSPPRHQPFWRNTVVEDDPPPSEHKPCTNSVTDELDTLPSTASGFTYDKVDGVGYGGILEEEETEGRLNGTNNQDQMAAAQREMEAPSISVSQGVDIDDQAREMILTSSTMPSVTGIQETPYRMQSQVDVSDHTPFLNAMSKFHTRTTLEPVVVESRPTENSNVLPGDNQVNAAPVPLNGERGNFTDPGKAFNHETGSKPLSFPRFVPAQANGEREHRDTEEQGSILTQTHTTGGRSVNDHARLCKVPSKKRMSSSKCSRSANRLTSDQRSTYSLTSGHSSPLRVVVDDSKDKAMHLAMTIGQRSLSFSRNTTSSQFNLRTTRRDQSVLWTIDPAIVQKHPGELTNYILLLKGANVLRQIPAARRQDVSFPLALQYISIITPPQFITPFFLHLCLSELKYVGLPLQDVNANMLDSDRIASTPFFDAQEVIEKAPQHVAILVDSWIVNKTLENVKKSSQSLLNHLTETSRANHATNFDAREYLDGKLEGYCDQLIRTCTSRFTCNVNDTLALGVDYALTRQKPVKSFAFAHKQCERIYEVYRCNSRANDEDSMIKCTLQLAAKLRRSEVVSLFMMPSILTPAVSYAIAQRAEHNPYPAVPIDTTTTAQETTPPFFGTEFCTTYVSAPEESIARCFTALFLSAFTEHNVFLEDPTSMLRFGVRKAAQKTFEIIQKQRYAYEEAKLRRVDALAKDATNLEYPSVTVAEIWDEQRDVAFVEPELDIGVLYVRQNRLYCTYTRGVMAYLFMCSDNTKIQCLPVSEVYETDNDKKGSRAIRTAIASIAAVDEKPEFDFLRTQPLELSKCSVTLPAAKDHRAMQRKMMVRSREEAATTKEEIQSFLDDLSVSLPNVAITSSRRYFDKSTLYFQFVLIRTMLLLDLYAAHSVRNKNRFFLARKLVEKVRLDAKIHRKLSRMSSDSREKPHRGGSNGSGSDGNYSTSQSSQETSSSSGSSSESCASLHADESFDVQEAGRYLDFNLCRTGDFDEFEDELCYDPLCLESLLQDGKADVCDHFGWKAMETHLPMKDTDSIWDSSTEETTSNDASENTFDSDKMDQSRRGAGHMKDRKPIRRAQRGQLSSRGRLQRKLSDRLSGSRRSITRDGLHSHQPTQLPSADSSAEERQGSMDMKKTSAVQTLQEKVDSWKQDICKEMVSKYREEREKNRKDRERPLFRRERRSLRQVVDAALLSSVKVGASEAEQERLDSNPSAMFVGTKSRKRLEREMKKQQRMQAATGANASPHSPRFASPKGLHPKPPTPLANTKGSFSSSRRRLSSGDAATGMPLNRTNSRGSANGSGGGSGASPLPREEEERPHLVPFDAHYPTPKKISPFSNPAKLMGNASRGNRGAPLPPGGGRRPLPRSGTLPKSSSFKKNVFGKSPSQKSDSKKPTSGPPTIEWTQDTRKRLCAFLAQRKMFHWYQAQAVMERGGTEDVLTRYLTGVQDCYVSIAKSIRSKRELERLEKEKQFFVHRRKNVQQRRNAFQQVFAKRMDEHYAAVKRGLMDEQSRYMDRNMDSAIRGFFCPHSHTRRLAPRAPWRMVMDKRIFMRYMCMSDDVTDVSAAHPEVTKKLAESNGPFIGAPYVTARDYAFEMQSVADMMTTVLKLEMMKKIPQRSPNKCTLSALLIPQYTARDDDISSSVPEDHGPVHRQPQPHMTGCVQRSQTPAYAPK